eukprot:5448986-Amphidinium_carterae.1
MEKSQGVYSALGYWTAMAASSIAGQEGVQWRLAELYEEEWLGKTDHDGHGSERYMHSHHGVAVPTWSMGADAWAHMSQVRCGTSPTSQEESVQHHTHMLSLPCCDTAVGEKKSNEKSEHAHCTAARAAKPGTEDACGRQQWEGEQYCGQGGDQCEGTCSPCGNTGGWHVHRELFHPEKCERGRHQQHGQEYSGDACSQCGEDSGWQAQCEQDHPEQCGRERRQWHDKDYCEDACSQCGSSRDWHAQCEQTS